jgi:hypothetical protein
MTVGVVPSEMRTPVGFAGAGTSPMFLAEVASVVVVALAWALWTTVAGGNRQPGRATAQIQRGETFPICFFVSALMSVFLDSPHQQQCASVQPCALKAYHARVTHQG